MINKTSDGDITIANYGLAYLGHLYMGHSKLRILYYLTTLIDENLVNADSAMFWGTHDK